MFNGQHADVHEAIHAVRQARLLALVQLAVLEGPGDALLEARLRQVMRFYPWKNFQLARDDDDGNKDTEEVLVAGSVGAVAYGPGSGCAAARSG